MKNIEWYIWKPNEWQEKNGFRVDMERCRYEVRDNYHFYQCQRRGKEEILGYKFCKQHAKIINKRFPNSEESE